MGCGFDDRRRWSMEAASFRSPRKSAMRSPSPVTQLEIELAARATSLTAIRD